MNTRDEVGQATWDSWPIAARMAIEKAEAALRKIWTEGDTKCSCVVEAGVALGEPAAVREQEKEVGRG